MKEEGVEVAAPGSLHGESHEQEEPGLDLVGVGDENVILGKDNRRTSGRNWWKVAFGILAVATIALVVTLGKVKSNEIPVVSQSNQLSGLVCDANSHRQMEDGVLRLTFGNMNTTLNDEQTLFLASTIKESYNSEAGCGELYQRYLDDVTVASQEVVRTKSGVSHLKTEIRTKVSFQCSDTNCPSAEEPMFSVTPSNERKLGNHMDEFRGVKGRELNALAVNANNVIEEIEKGLRRDDSMNKIYVDEAVYGASDKSRVDYRKKSGKKIGKKTEKKTDKYGAYFDGECANYTETYTITLEVILQNDTDIECFESIPDEFAVAHNIVANVSDNCEDGQRTWEGIGLIGVSSNTEEPFVLFDSRRRRSLIEQDEESQRNRRNKAEKKGTVDINVRGDCGKCTKSKQGPDISNKKGKVRYLQTSETECCEPPTTDALLEQFNSQFEGECIEEVTGVVSISIVDDGTYRNSSCIPDGYSFTDTIGCSDLESSDIKCCNTCEEFGSGGHSCVECLGSSYWNSEYDTCAEFEASGQICCDGSSCEPRSGGGVECVLDCLPDGSGNSDDTCSGLDIKCCNTCEEFASGGHSCVVCLEENKYNDEYNTCTDFEASGQTCCDGSSCEPRSGGGVECVLDCLPVGSGPYSNGTCSDLDEKCCNTCRDYTDPEGYECVECLEGNAHNYEYNTCDDFEASGQTCCTSCIVEIGGGVRCRVHE